MQPPTTVSTGKQKQDVIIGDDTGTTTLTLWEQNIGILTENTSYQLSRVQVHSYLGRSELTFPVFGAAIEERDMLENVLTYTDDQVYSLQSVSIMGVSAFETTFNCIN